MRSIAVVVFSKDRPMQLDATLRSFRHHDVDGSGYRPSVLFRASGHEYESAYQLLRLQYPDVTFHPEADFKLDLLSIVGRAEFVLFVVDDTIFTGPLAPDQAAGYLDAEQGLIGFSFRLGRNTTYSYALDRPQALPDFSELGADTLEYEWTVAEHDFGYPIELSTSLYRSSDIRPLLGWLSYHNPNSLEDALAGTTRLFNESRPRLACLSRSVAVSVPVNVVQADWPNRSGSQQGLDADALRVRFECGERIDVMQYDGVVPEACHQELGIALVKDPTIPRVSVVIRCSEGGRYLQAAIDDLVSQSLPDWEALIIDESGISEVRDTEGRLLDEYPGARLRLVSQHDKDETSALDRGLANSLGRHILLVDEGRHAIPPDLSAMSDLLDRDATFDVVRVPGYAPLCRRHLWYRAGFDRILLGPAGALGPLEDGEFLRTCAESGVNVMHLAGQTS